MAAAYTHREGGRPGVITNETRCPAYGDSVSLGSLCSVKTQHLDLKDQICLAWNLEPWVALGNGVIVSRAQKNIHVQREYIGAVSVIPGDTQARALAQLHGGHAIIPTGNHAANSRLRGW